MIPIKSSKLPQTLVGIAALVFLFKDPEGAAAAVETAISVLTRFVNAF